MQQIIELGNWHSQAACGSRDPEVAKLDFFSDRRREQKACVAVCMTQCPVRRKCLAEALANEETFGVWGGRTLRQMRLALAIDAYGTTHDWGQDIECPACESQNVTLSRKRRVRVCVTCNDCDFTWDRRRIIKSRTLKDEP